MNKFQRAPLAKNEEERLKALRKYNILDTEREKIFDELAQLVSYICDVPMALITFMDKDRQWHKSKIGVAEQESIREESFCQYAILEEDIFEVENTDDDELFKFNPHAQGEKGIKFYASASLNTKDGHAIGNVCVMDNKPKKLTDEQKACLKTIAKQIMTQLELRKINLDLKEELEELLEAKIEETKSKLLNKEVEANYLKESLDKANATLSLDLDAKILHANDHFCQLSGYEREELVGKEKEILMDPNEVNEEYFNMWEELRKGNYQNGQFKLITKENKEKWILANYNPIYNAFGTITHILTIVQDISNEVKYRKQLENAKKTAEKAVISKDRFLSNMSHEIRTPLNAIIGFTEILKSEELTDEQLDHVLMIAKAGDNLLNIINDILDLSKIQSGKFKFEQKDFELYAMFDNVYKIMLPKAQEKGIELKKELDFDFPLWLKGDEYRLNQILFNLINNAIKFTEKGKVSIISSVEKKAKSKVEVLIDIKDTGIGVAPDKQKLIFERFSQADTGITRKYGGTGLGLSIVKLLIDNFKGSIVLKSEEGKGSTFSLKIPLKIGQKIDSLEESSNHTPDYSRNKHLLMVEDNPLNQKLGKHLIERLGYILTIKNNGLEAVEWLKENKTHLILMDLQMPEMDGYEATKCIRKDLNSSTPIIAMTAHSLGSEKERCIEIGMNDFISKPFKAKDLENIIYNYLDNPELIEESPSNAEEVLFDLNELRKLAHGNDEFFKEIIQMFIRESRKEINLIDDAFEKNDYNAISDLAHKLKSNYKIIGFNRMDLIASLEKINDIKPDSKQIKIIIDQLRIATDNVISEMKEAKLI